VKLDTFVNTAFYCCTLSLVLRNTFQWRTTKTISRLRLRSIIYSVQP
jgi:hypothetical protein